jgi:IS30 family transposase
LINRPTPQLFWPRLHYRNKILKRLYPNERKRHVSLETIYTAIYAQPRGELRRQLIACLRQGHGTCMPRTRGVDRRGQIPGMLSVHVRLPEIEDRVMPGHWEGDFLKGQGNQSSVGVLVERSSRSGVAGQNGRCNGRISVGRLCWQTQLDCRTHAA